MSTSFDTNRHSRNPSFSSVLLDSIYRSLGDGDDADADADTPLPPPSTTPPTSLLLPPSPPPTTTTTTTDPRPNHKPTKKDKSVNLKRAIMIDHWIDKQQDKQDSLLAHMYCVPSRKPNRRSSSSAATPSTSSSSESVFAAAGTGSSSEASCFATPQIPLKIRTTFASRSSTDSRSPPPQPFITRTKSRALKIYADLKKANQQPISPGAKIAGFLNSIFTGSTWNSKPQHSSPNDNRQQKPPPSTSTSNSSSACSSASSFSRSCLSKSTAPSSSSSGGNAVDSASSGKRSVRFYPLSVIVGEDSRPCGHKFLYERSDPKAARSAKSAKLTKLPNVGRTNPWYLRGKENGLSGGNDDREMIGGGQGNEEDADSYASSDLFELENMESVMYGYDEELPVYGTTSFEKNKSILMASSTNF